MITFTNCLTRSLKRMEDDPFLNKPPPPLLKTCLYLMYNPSSQLGIGLVMTEYSIRI
jgi:hypothetical protein